MQLNIRDNIQINGIDLKATRLEITDTGIKAYTNYVEAPISNIKLLEHGNIKIIEDGKLALKCDNNCKDCPMCEDARLEVYTNPNSYKLEWAYRCSKSDTYSERIEDLPFSRTKSKKEIELKKAYELIKEHFLYRRTDYVTKESLKKVFDNIDDALTPNMYEHYNEYGHVRIELETIEIRKNRYGYTLWYDGRMGDYGLSSRIYLSDKCDVGLMASELRNRYYGNYRTKVVNKA